MKKVLIIGAGLGGLMAGNLLAKKGHRVIIFESHSMPGGYTAGFWRNGFYYESGTLSFEASAQVFKAMKEIGVFDKISFVRHEPFRFICQDFDGIAATYEDYKRLYYDAYLSDKDRLDRYFTEVDKMYQAMKSLAAEGIIPKVIGGINMLGLYLKHKNITTSQFAARYFEKGSRLYRHFEQVGYPDMAALLIGGAFWSILEDYWTVKDGMQSWADVLADNFQQLGGELKLKSYVDKILTRNGAAVGVRCKDTEYEADYVISASDYKQTFLKLLDKTAISDELYDKISSTNVSEGMVAVYLGLNISSEALKESMKSSYVMYRNVSVDVDVYNANDEHYFEKASFAIYSPSLKNPKLAPEGKSSLMITVQVPYRWLDTWGSGDRKTYLRLKEQMHKTLVKRASIVIPNLKDLIEYQDAATPLTFERFTHNTDGATSAWSWNPHKKFYTRTFSINVKTPVKNLLIGSCWATQFGGIPGALSAAYECVKRIA